METTFGDWIMCVFTIIILMFAIISLVLIPIFNYYVSGRSKNYKLFRKSKSTS